MKAHVTGNWEMNNWQEEPYHELPGSQKLTRASVDTVLKGEIEGEGKLMYLIAYVEDNCPFIGYERVVGRVGERSGSFVLEHKGVFANNSAKWTVSVVPGSGTGELKGLRGEGRGEAIHNDPVILTLDYEID